jgi:hypothetical protein
MSSKFYDRVDSQPSQPHGRAAAARRHAMVAGVAVATAVLVLVATLGFRAYGWTVFVLVPFFVGWGFSLLVSDEGVGFVRATGSAIASLLGCGMLLLLGRFEGLICLAMLAPLAAPLVIAGVVCGYLVRRGLLSRLPVARSGTMAAIALLAAPGGLAVDAGRTADAPRHQVSTVVEIDAPPAAVWRHVVQFNELPPATEWIFRGGVAHPLRARIAGVGVGAVRYCEFSTGAFVEPITVWDAPHRLAFTVARSPAPLTELNPFGAVHPPHLDGYLVSERGEFRLEALPGGRTRLTGTTWYRHHLFPDRYWTLWSDVIIHRIHQRVLRHIETLATAAPSTPTISNGRSE